MTKIFISHSNQDNEFVRQLAQALKDLGLDIWIDFIDIPAGMNWSTAIQQALDECEAMIVVISPEAMASTDVENEWQYYIDENKRLIPIRWQPAKVHFQLRRIQYVDFHKKDFSAALDRLREELQRQGFPFANASPSAGAQRAAPKVLRVEDILPLPFAWCKISAGKVVLEDASADGGTIGGIFEIPVFWICKYPITIAQYQVFIDAKDGYADSQWWKFSEEAMQRRIQGLLNDASGFLRSNQPRTDITWFDAVAFCRWLTKKTGQHINLPTEEQWQRAAVGDEKWTYPWGNEFDRRKSNTRESGVDEPTSVMQYPSGASPYGVMDMSGNVSEWCLNDWATGELDISRVGKRPIRGGSWYHNHEMACATFRTARHPIDTYSTRGFRLVSLDTK